MSNCGSRRVMTSRSPRRRATLPTPDDDLLHSAKEASSSASSSSVPVINPSLGTIAVRASLMSGAPLAELSCKVDLPILELKRLLAVPSDTPARYQQLLFGGRVLGDLRTLEEEQLPPSACVELVKVLPNPASLLSIEEDDPLLISYLMRCRADISEFDTELSTTPLTRAAERGLGSVVVALVGQNDIVVDFVDESGKSALHWAAQNGLTLGCEALVQHADFSGHDWRDNDGRTSLQLAAAAGHLAVCEVLEGHVDFSVLNERHDGGTTSLHLAAAGGYVDVCEMLLGLEEFSEMNACDWHGGTALHQAATAGHVSVCEALLRCHRFTALGVTDGDGMTALHYAAQAGHRAVCDSLVARGDFAAVAARRAVTGETSLHLAAASGLASVCSALLRRSDFSATDLRGLDAMTALHYAAFYGQVGSCKALLSTPGGRTADANLRDVAGRTPLDVAVRYGRTAAARAIRALTVTKRAR